MTLFQNKIISIPFMSIRGSTGAGNLKTSVFLAYSVSLETKTVREPYSGAAHTYIESTT